MRLSNPDETCLPTTTWFLYSEVQEKPLGRIYLIGIQRLRIMLKEAKETNLVRLLGLKSRELPARCVASR